jgi:hypothetical protein
MCWCIFTLLSLLPISSFSFFFVFFFFFYFSFFLLLFFFLSSSFIFLSFFFFYFSFFLSSSSSMALHFNANHHLFNGLLAVRSVLWPLFPVCNFASINSCLYAIPLFFFFFFFCFWSSHLFTGFAENCYIANTNIRASNNQQVPLGSRMASCWHRTTVHWPLIR